MSKDFEKIVEATFEDRTTQKSSDNKFNKGSDRDKRNSKENHTTSMRNSMRLSANLNFSRPNASKVTHYTADGIEQSSEFTTGIAAITMDTGIPSTQNAMDPVNVVTQVVYSQIREKVSGRKNYDSEDVFFYFYGHKELRKLYHFLAKAVKVAQKYSPINFATPKMYLKAMGFQPEQFIDDLCHWQTFMDMFCNKLNSLLVPDIFKLYRDQDAIWDKFYYDNDATKSQVYTFIPKYIYNLQTFTSGNTVGIKNVTKVSWENYTTPSISAGVTLENIKTWVNDIFDAMLSSFAVKGIDLGVISGDMARVYTKFVKVTPVSVSDPIPVTYDKNMLQRIQNTTLFGNNYQPESVQEMITAAGVRQHYIKALRKVGNSITGCDILASGKFVNSLVPHPTAEQTCDYVKYAPILFSYDTSHNYILDYGYVAASMSMWTYNLSSGGALQYLQYGISDGQYWNIGIGGSDLTYDFTRLAMLTKYDWHPQIRSCAVYTEGSTTNIIPITGYFDLGIWAEYDPMTMRDLQPAVVASELAV